MGSGGFCFAPISPEQIHLKHHVSSELKNVGLDVLIGFAAAEYWVQRYLRELIRTGDAELSSRGSDAFHRQLQIVVLLQCRPDEFLQLRIVEDLPPGQIGNRCGLRFRLLRIFRAVKDGWGLHGRPVIVRSDRTAREHERCKQDRRGFCGEIGLSITHLVDPPSSHWAELQAS